MSITGSRKGQGRSISRSGIFSPSRGITLIEVMLSVVILTVGIISVLRTYAVLLDGMNVSRDVLESMPPLRSKLAEIEQKNIETSELPRTGEFGRYKEGHSDYKWTVESKEIKVNTEGSKIDETKDPKKDEMKDLLYEVKLTVVDNRTKDAVGSSLTTYMRSIGQK